MITKKAVLIKVCVSLLCLVLVGIQEGHCGRNPSEETVVVSTAQTRDTRNATVMFQISLDPGSTTIGGMTFSIVYDGSAYRFTGLEKSSVTARSLVVHKQDSGKIRFGFIDMKGINTKGVAFTLKFSLPGDAVPGTPISLLKATCSDHLGNLVPVTQSNLTERP